MYYYDSAYYGMHFFWWCFWILFWVSFFAMLAPVPRRQWQKMRETPKEVLLRRFANGELSGQEFENRKSIMDKEILRK